MTKKPSRLDNKSNKKLTSLLYYPLIIGIYLVRLFSYFPQPFSENLILYFYKIFNK